MCVQFSYSIYTYNILHYITFTLTYLHVHVHLHYSTLQYSTLHVVTPQKKRNVIHKKNGIYHFICLATPRRDAEKCATRMLAQ